MHPIMSIKTTNGIRDAQSDEEEVEQRWFVLYMPAKASKAANWHGDGLLTVTRRAKIILHNDNTQKIAEQQCYKGLGPFEAGQIVYVSSFRVELQERFHGPSAMQAVAEITNAVVSPHISTSSATTKHFQSVQPHTTSSEQYVWNEVCEACKTAGRGCDSGNPCQMCVAERFEYCSRSNQDRTILQRYPVSGTSISQTDQQLCHNCKIMGFDCDQDTPCSQCLEQNRALCTFIQNDGTVQMIRCGAFNIIRFPSGASRTVRIPSCKPDNVDEWPETKSTRPSDETLARLHKRFATEYEKSHYIDEEELMHQFRYNKPLRKR